MSDSPTRPPGRRRTSKSQKTVAPRASDRASAGTGDENPGRGSAASRQLAIKPDLNLGLIWDHVFPVPPREFRVHVRRPDDLLVFDLVFDNLQLAPEGPPRLVRKSASAGASITVEFPPQSFGEQAFLEAAPEVADAQSETVPPLPSAKVRMSGPSRVVVAMPSDEAELPLTLPAVLVFEGRTNPAALPGDLPIAGRLLDLSSPDFDLLNVDVDGAGLKVMNFARSLARKIPAAQRADSVTRFEETAGAPALRTAGVMLVQRKRATMLQSRIAAGKSMNDAAQDVFAAQPGALGPELWAEDVVRGFRIDIWDRTTSRWRSLCRRSAVYDLGNGQVVVNVPDEETMVRLAATHSSDPASNAGVLYLHEALVSWTGWSLAAPPPGRAVLPDDSVDSSTAQTDATIPPGLHLATTFTPVKGSLPRLRFGREYWMRGRVVDLAGNSLPPIEGDHASEAPAQHARPFVRFEPLAAPVVALVRPEGQPTERPSEGESMEHLAIRTFNDIYNDPTPAAQVARRFLVPVQASARDAELHGALDVNGQVGAGLFDLLANQRDRDAADPAAALQEELVPLQGPLDPTPVETTFAVYRDGHTLTYLRGPTHSRSRFACSKTPPPSHRSTRHPARWRYRFRRGSARACVCR